MSLSGRGWAQLFGAAGLWAFGVAAPSTVLGQGDSVPAATAGPAGFSIRSRDGSFQFRLKGYIQADGRFFPGVPDNLGTSTFLLWFCDGESRGYTCPGTRSVNSISITVIADP